MNKNFHDLIILKIFSNKNGNLNSGRIKKIPNYKNISNYLNNRFEFISSYTEALNRIKYHIEIRPVCPICGKKVHYKKSNIFTKTCSSSCSFKNSKYQRINTCITKYGEPNILKSNIIKDKIKKTNLDKYGVENPFANKQIQDKIRKTNLERYEVEYSMQNKLIQEKSKHTNLEKYGVEYSMQNKLIQEKSKHTNLEKYGVDCILKSKEIQEKIKKTNLGRYGVENPVKNLEIRKKLSKKLSSFECQQKIYNTKKKNHSFNISKPEKELGKYIKIKFPDVKFQYKDKNRYPWFCDFYIPSLDYFIELNIYWTHGTHPYNSNNIEDNKLLKEWENKYNSTKHPLYKRAILGWTRKDVEKRNTAIKNNLYYKEIWSLDEGKKFIDNLYEKHK